MTDRHEPQLPDGTQGSRSDNDTGAIKNTSKFDGVKEISSSYVGRLLCWFGWHDYRVIDATFGFGLGANVERVECKQCGRLDSRSC